MKYIGKRQLTTTQARDLVCKGFRVILKELTAEDWDVYEIYVDTFNQPKAKKDPMQLYNIHKRSLPAELDQPVFLGVIKSEADYLTNNILKTKTIEKNGEVKIIYYDIIATNATREEMDIYYNEPMEVNVL